ncbi:zinc-dependent peptidase [Parahaliea aestuarii]|uniref:Zinc-dependent peptidase n=1 Tax=Parahaliea aestuarii TaxID=1852021 RepID=A0A5C9A0Q1_9GAMM|nr:M90 family metallopeptidase [Parahaliea aestuarii]TXS93564.1 zinc-dependent peptidase [Parahaliea aestuarii]
MNNWVWLALACAVLGLAYWISQALPRWRFERAMAAPFPDHWLPLLQRFPFYERLGAELQAELRRKVQAFLYRKRFVGCEGLEVTDERRVLIATEACLLILNRPNTLYRDLKWIYIYPSTFRSRQPERDEAGVVSLPSGDLLGVSWSNGRVVLAWDSVKHGYVDFEDGQNVVLHEFAHQLDQEGGVADGAPLLNSRAAYGLWSQVLGREFEELQRAVQYGHATLIDSYGATNPAEFFAVITELFYERPVAMQATHPELFATLKSYFQVDPRDWQAPAT